MRPAVFDLETPRLRIRLPRPRDAAAIAAYYLRNRARFDALDPPRPEGFFTEAFWAERVEALSNEAALGLSYRWFLFARGDDEGPVLGQISLTNLVRGPLQSATVGYSLDAAAEGQGLMRETLGRVVQFAFEGLRLHRVEAGHLPDNHRSAKVLESLGFEAEGYAPRFLFVGGAWRDHVRRARVCTRDAPPGT